MKKFLEFLSRRLNKSEKKTNIQEVKPKRKPNTLPTPPSLIQGDSKLARRTWKYYITYISSNDYFPKKYCISVATFLWSIIPIGKNPLNSAKRLDAKFPDLNEQSLDI